MKHQITSENIPLVVESVVCSSYGKSHKQFVICSFTDIQKTWIEVRNLSLKETDKYNLSERESAIEKYNSL